MNDDLEYIIKLHFSKANKEILPPLADAKDQFEWDLINTVLAHLPDQRKAAKFLGMKRTTLNMRIAALRRRLHIDS